MIAILNLTIFFAVKFWPFMCPQWMVGLSKKNNSKYLCFILRKKKLKNSDILENFELTQLWQPC